MSHDKHLRCSFCGKSKDSVRKFISGPSVYICNECIALCNEILAEDEEREVAEAITQVPTPQEIKDVLDQYVIGQETRQEDPRRRRLQPLQAHQFPLQRTRFRRGARQEQHPLDRPHRRGQDAPGPDPGPDSRRPLHHRRRHHAHRSGLRGRGRGEHSGPPAPGRGLQRLGVRARHRLHRRDRQDRPEVREPQHHPRRLGRRGAAGAPQDPRGHHRQRSPPGGPQASRSRNTSRSTPRTFSSSAAGPSTGSRRSSSPAPAGGRSASARKRSPRARPRSGRRIPSPTWSPTTCSATG